MAFPYTFEEIIAACLAPGVEPVEGTYGGSMNREGKARLCPLCCLVAAQPQRTLTEACNIADRADEDNGAELCDILGITKFQEAGFVEGVDGNSCKNLSEEAEAIEAYNLGVRVRSELFDW